ncbi:hypothetical protein [Paenibacillus catalpae]|uniref:hypothetical protein n=1 Tax=Paenibacillus catalpae TaxID=1045775 RepID=UPI00158781CA|nr:hypothetical protein [Paenibacillus catalpae]
METSLWKRRDEQALKIIDDLRNQMKKTGYDDAVKYMNEKLKGKEIVTLQMPN